MALTNENADPNIQQEVVKEDASVDNKKGVKKEFGKSKWKKKKGGKHQGALTVSSFKGTIPEMNGHVFECHGEAHAASQFHRTMEELQSYTTRMYKFGDDVCYIVRKLKEYNMEQHELPYPPKTKDSQGQLTVDPTETKIKIWEKLVDAYVKRCTGYDLNKSSLYMVIWSQCSKAMKAKLKMLDAFEAIDKHRKPLELLLEIKNISFKFEAQGKYVHKLLFNAKQAFYRYVQGPVQSNAVYLEKFK